MPLMVLRIWPANTAAVDLTPGTFVHARVRTAPASAGGHVDELGHRAARRRLGGARRAGGLGGDRNGLRLVPTRLQIRSMMRRWSRNAAGLLDLKQAFGGV